jgi:hypothetical protein
MGRKCLALADVIYTFADKGETYFRYYVAPDCLVLYQFGHKFTNSEIFVTKMADKFSFQFWRF